MTEERGHLQNFMCHPFLQNSNVKSREAKESHNNLLNTIILTMSSKDSLYMTQNKTNKKDSQDIEIQNLHFPELYEKDFSRLR